MSENIINRILYILTLKYNTNKFSQFHTCYLSQSGFLQRKRSSKRYILSLIYCTNHSMKFFNSAPYTRRCNPNHLQGTLYHLEPSMKIGFPPYLFQAAKEFIADKNCSFSRRFIIRHTF